MDSVFVTGGTGFVGANLVRLLLEKGFRVRALARRGGDRRNLEGLAVEIVEGDLGDGGALQAGVRGARYVFHVAADYRIWVPRPDEMYATNIAGTIRVLEAAAAAGAEKIVHCSSVAAVRPARDRRAVDETSEYPGPEAIVGPYKKSKFLAERAALELAAKGAPIVVVNPSAPIGPYDIKPTPTGKIVVDFLRGRIPSYIDTGLNVVHVLDVALGHYLAALRGRPGQRYILGGENLTLKALLETLAEITGRPGPRFKTPYAVAWVFSALDSARARAFGAEPLAPLDAVKMAKYYMWFDSSKAGRELGFSPAAARQALVDAVAYFTSHGYSN
ncbi:MAG: NAD-dependent epimerase/dehydratase family protein [Elusimicrobia bacterium]|nr:NAD-dependent epimerase/dehydratase family protein [Elusimicrobiota bacterium]